MTDCKGCKHETECNYTQRYDYTHTGILDYSLDKEYNSYKDISKLLNWQDEQIQNQKMEINLLLEEMKEIRDKLTIYLEIKGDVE